MEVGGDASLAACGSLAQRRDKRSEPVVLLPLQQQMLLLLQGQVQWLFGRGYLEGAVEWLAALLPVCPATVR